MILGAEKKFLFYLQLFVPVPNGPRAATATVGAQIILVGRISIQS
jgi:hypothetical protein